MQVFCGPKSAGKSGSRLAKEFRAPKSRKQARPSNIWFLLTANKNNNKINNNNNNNKEEEEEGEGNPTTESDFVNPLRLPCLIMSTTTKAAISTLLCSLVLLAILLIATGGPQGARAQAPEGQLLRRQREFAREMSDLLRLTPPFAPTRSPAMVHFGSGTSQQSGPQHSQHQQASPAAVGLHPTGSGAASSPAGKFVRTNELDVFLDDMNHNELREVASGRPIDDLFQAKPMLPNAVGPISSAQAHDRRQQQVSPTNYANLSSAATSGDQGASGRQAAGGGGGGLMGSHSEQQIYSECALILQRTYVKNIDDPK